MAKLPYFPIYVADFLVGTAGMSNADVGIYFRLLCHQWDRGPIEKVAASKLVKAKLSADVLGKFVEVQGRLSNKRLEDVRREQNEKHLERVAAGRKGAQNKWLSHSLANGSAIAEPLAKAWQSESESESESEGKKKDKGSAAPNLDLPFASNQFQEAWADFVAMRSEIKKPLKATAIKLSFAKLSEMGEATAIQSLKESTASQWQGLFEPKGNQNGNGNRTDQNSSRQRPANPGSSAGNEREWADRFEAEQADRTAEAAKALA